MPCGMLSIMGASGEQGANCTPGIRVGLGSGYSDEQEIDVSVLVATMPDKCEVPAARGRDDYPTRIDLARSRVGGLGEGGDWSGCIDRMTRGVQRNPLPGRPHVPQYLVALGSRPKRKAE